jgi:hypothetical protein
MSPRNVSDSEGNDLNARIKQILTDLRLLEDPTKDAKVTWFGGTPENLQA